MGNERVNPNRVTGPQLRVAYSALVRRYDDAAQRLKDRQKELATCRAQLAELSGMVDSTLRVTELELQVRIKQEENATQASSIRELKVLVGDTNTLNTNTLRKAELLAERLDESSSELKELRSTSAVTALRLEVQELTTERIKMEIRIGQLDPLLGVEKALTAKLHRRLAGQSERVTAAQAAQRKAQAALQGLERDVVSLRNKNTRQLENIALSNSARDDLELELADMRRRVKSLERDLEESSKCLERGLKAVEDEAKAFAEEAKGAATELEQLRLKLGSEVVCHADDVAMLKSEVKKEKAKSRALRKKIKDMKEAA